MIDRLPPLLVAAALAACSTEAPPIAADPAPAQPAARAPLYHEPTTRLRFPLAAEGVSVEARHHDPSLPPQKIRHSLRLLVGGRVAVLIDVWDNPAKLALRPWFEAHLAYLARSTTEVSERVVTRARVPGILLREPRSPQALSQRIAVFAAGDRVIRVTCLDDEGHPEHLAIFERVIDELSSEVAP